MEKIIKLIKEIESEVILAEKERMLLYVTDYIQEILSKIRLCSDMQKSDYYFDILEEVQAHISIIISEDKVQIPDSLWKLYTDFDRIDDKKWREYLFEKIKLGNYSLAGEPVLYDCFPCR